MAESILITDLTVGKYLDTEGTPEDALLQTVQNVTLLNTTRRIYEGCSIELIRGIYPREISPIVKYAIESNIVTLGIIREHCSLHHDVDILALDGVFEIQDNNGNSMIIAPPVVEFLPEGIYGIIDGIHRFVLADQLGLPINIVKVTGVPSDLPPISYPVSWDEVVIANERPTEPEKVRNLRFPNERSVLERYYRDFRNLGSGGRRTMVHREA